MPAILPILIELLSGGIDSAIVLSAAPGGVAMLAAIAAAGLFMALAVAHACPAVASAALHPAAVRHRAKQTVFLALCDPGAAGRPRPRAPSVRRRAV